MVTPFGEGIWVVEQPFRFLGIPLGARMTVLRYGNGDLLLHSPLEIDDATRREIDALGPVRAIVAPSRLHYLCTNALRRHYPEARVYGSPAFAKRSSGIDFSGILRAEAEDAWAGDLDQIPLQGHRFLDEVLFFHRPSRTLVVTDLIASTHRADPWSARLFGRVDGIYERPALPVTLRLGFGDRGAARETVDRVLGWDFDRVVLSHGHLIPEGGKALVRRAYEFLAR
jgi:hypothetical protein